MNRDAMKEWAAVHVDRGRRQMVAELVADRTLSNFGFCPFCGVPCAGAACRNHRDLIDIEAAQLHRSAA